MWNEAMKKYIHINIFKEIHRCEGLFSAVVSMRGYILPKWESIPDTFLRNLWSFTEHHLQKKTVDKLLLNSSNSLDVSLYLLYHLSYLPATDIRRVPRVFALKIFKVYKSEKDKAESNILWQGWLNEQQCI